MSMRKLSFVGFALSMWVALCVTAAGALAAPPEAPVTKAATGVSSTQATLNGELNPGASAKAGYFFAYNTTGSCTEGPTTPQEAEAEGKAIKVSAPLTKLEGSTEYTFCLVATRLENEITESTFGPALSFKTTASKPVIGEAGPSASGVTPFAATLEAQVNPENETTTACQFVYGTTAKVLTSSGECEPSSIEGSSEQRVSTNITGLEPATIYHFRVDVTNATGETQSSEGEFTTLTLEKPLVSGQSASAVSAIGATLNALVNPDYQETTFSFEYATNEALVGATTVEGASPLAAEFGEFPVSVKTGPLQPRTTYYYRAVAKNGTGTTDGEPVEHFTTQATPIVTVEEAEEVTRTTAVVSGTVNPSGAATTYHFAYMDEAAYQAALLADPADPFSLAKSTPNTEAGSGFGEESVGPVTLRELNAGTTYHYALVATNSAGMGAIEPGTESEGTFTTAVPTAPIVSTGGAAGVSQLSATINGSVDTRGLQTTAQFEFGTTPGQGSLLPGTLAPGPGTTLAIYASFVNDLLPGTTYYYRALASNQDGTTYGAESSFTTGAFPSPFPSLTTPALLPPVPPIAEEGGKPGHGIPHLMNVQKLKKALKACKKKPKKQRAGCERKAKKKYGAKKKGKKK